MLFLEPAIETYTMALMEKLFLIAFLQVPVSQAQTHTERLTVRALRGSCVVIPCTFSNPEPRRAPEELRIDWYLLGPLSLVYSGKSPDKVLPQYRGRADFVGDLNSGDCSLRINNIRGDDAAEYSPWIEPLSGSYEKYKVTVSDHPEEMSVSDPGEMTEGIPVKIACSAVHTCPSTPPILTWDWQGTNVRDYSEDLRNGRWKVASEMYYTPKASDHRKSLQCTATYTENMTSKRNITMTIRYPPKNTAAVHRGNTRLREGDTVMLSCSAAGNPDVFDYSWYEGPEEKPLLGHGQNMTVKSIRWNSGPYSCIITNTVGSGKSAPLDLNIEHAPKGIQVIVEPNPVEGAPLTLTCMARSSNPPVTNYTWYKDGHLMHDHSPELKWQKVTPEHSGLYHCMAHNNLGISSSSPVNVSVHYAPKGTHIYATETNIKKGGRMELECKTNSSKPAVDHYIWYRDGNKLQNRSEKNFIIENIMPAGSGHYHCEAHNQAGNSSSADINITVEESTLQFKSFAALGVTTAFLVLLLLALFLFLWTRRNKAKKQADQNHSIPKVPEEQIVYVTIDHSKEHRSQKRKDPSDDFVTYAAVKSHPDSDVAYAEVKKPLKTPKKKEEEIIYATDLRFNRPAANGSESWSVSDDFVEYAAVKHRPAMPR